MDEQTNKNDRVKRNVKLANDIDDKIAALGMRRPPGMGAHLSDICIALEESNELINEFLSTDPKDLEKIGETLIAIQVHIIEHINYHIKHVKRPLERVINYCYPEEDEEDS